MIGTVSTHATRELTITYGDADHRRKYVVFMTHLHDDKREWLTHCKLEDGEIVSLEIFTGGRFRLFERFTDFEFTVRIETGAVDVSRYFSLAGSICHKPWSYFVEYRSLHTTPKILGFHVTNVFMFESCQDATMFKMAL